MSAMKRVTLLFPEDLWNDLATAASLRAQSRGQYAREMLRMRVDQSLVMAGMKKDPEEEARAARRRAETMDETGGEE
jgi:hypothetical protein